MKTSLAIKSEGAPAMTAPQSGKSADYYPEFSISDKAAKAIIDQVEVGQEITATVTLRVSGMSERKNRYDDGCRVEFEVMDIDLPGVEESEDEEESAEDAIDKYKQGQSGDEEME